MGQQLVLVVVLVLLNAALAGTEMALVSLRDTQLDRLAGESRAGARLAEMARNPSRFLATIQVGITLAGFGASASAAVTLAGPVAEALEPTVGARADGVAVLVVTIALAYLTLVFGELAPKRIAMQASQRWALLAVRPLGLLQTVTAPAVWLLERSSNLVVRMLGFDPDAEAEDYTEDELRELVVGHDQLDEFHRRVLEGAFEVADRVVGQVLTPRRDVMTLPAGLAVDEGRDRLAASGFSRAPVVGEQGLDDVVGVVHLRDLLDTTTGSAAPAPLPPTVGGRAHTATLLPESAGVLDALRALQAARSQLGVVVDEHGGGEGVVTVEDLCEELVGEIFDRSDPDFATVERDGERLLVPGRFPVHDLEDLGVDVPEGRYTTIAGYVLEQLGRVPEQPGDVVVTDAGTFEVLDIDRLSIARVAVLPPPGDELAVPDGPE